MIIDNFDTKTQESFYSNMLQLYKDINNKEIFKNTYEKYKKEIDSLGSDYFKKNYELNIDTKTSQSSFKFAEEELPKIKQNFYNNFNISDQNIDAIKNHLKIDCMSSMCEKISNNKSIQYFMFFDAFKSKNYIITEEMFLKAKNSIKNMPTIPSYEIFDKCCVELKKLYMSCVDLLDDEIDHIQINIFQGNRHFFNDYRVKQNKKFELKKFSKTDNFTFNIKNIDFWYSRKIFYVKDEQKIYKKIFKFIKKYRKKYRSSDLKLFDDFIDVYIESMKEKYNKKYAKILYDINYLQTLVKDHNYNDIKQIYDFYVTSKNKENYNTKDENQKAKRKPFFKIWNFDTFKYNLFRNNFSENIKFQCNIEDFIYQIYNKLYQKDINQKFDIISDDGIALKYSLFPESVENEILRKKNNQFNFFDEFNKVVCNNFLQTFNNQYKTIKVYFYDFNLKKAEAIDLFEKFCDYNKFIPEDKLLNDDIKLLKKLDRISSTLYFSSLFGFHLNESFCHDHLYFDDLNDYYNDAYRILDDKDWSFQKNRMQNMNEDHQDIVKTYQDALKHELNHRITKKKQDLDFFDKYIEKNKIDATFKKFVKKNILLSIQLSFLLFETSVAASNITLIIKEYFLSSTENEKGVLSKEYISEVYPEQSETLK
ncbi:hypothetical protein GVAV_001004 [Gurleya vavrai]